jgi:hypothetical protein
VFAIAVPLRASATAAPVSTLKEALEDIGCSLNVIALFHPSPVSRWKSRDLETWHAGMVGRVDVSQISLL